MKNQEQDSPPTGRSPRPKKTLLQKKVQELFFLQSSRKLAEEREFFAPGGPVAELLKKGVLDKDDLVQYADFVSDYLKKGVPTAHEKLYAKFLTNLKYSPPSHRGRILERFLRAEGIVRPRKKGGRPKLTLDKHRDFFLGKLVAQNLGRFQEGLTLLRQLRGKYPAQQVRWRQELKQQGFHDYEIDAFISSRTPLAAACVYIARTKGNIARTRELRPQSVRNAYYRWKELTP